MIRAAVLRRGPSNHTDEAFPHEIRQHLLPVTSVARTLLGRTRGHVRSSQESKNKCTASTTCKSTGCYLEPGASNTCHGAIVHCLLSIVIQRAMSLAAKRSCTLLTPRPTAFFFLRDKYSRFSRFPGAMLVFWNTRATEAQIWFAKVPR